MRDIFIRGNGVIGLPDVEAEIIADSQIYRRGDEREPACPVAGEVLFAHCPDDTENEPVYQEKHESAQQYDYGVGDRGKEHQCREYYCYDAEGDESFQPFPAA